MADYPSPNSGSGDDAEVEELTTLDSEDSTEFEPVYHRYTPHRAGLPPLIPYARELWHRRTFASEMSRATMRGANISTVFGQAWLVLNPLMLAGVYYLLVTIIRQQHDPTLFLHLTLGLFAFNLISASVTTGATSVTSSGKLLINTAFPRLLIPLSAVRTAFFRYLPTVPVYLIFHMIIADPSTWHPRMILSLYFLAMMVVFGMGLAAFFATLQIYFRDTSSFLPYFVRIWMYLSPVLWKPDMLSRFSPTLRTLVELNPTYSMLTGYVHLVQGGSIPPLWMWLAAAAWAIGTAAVGFLYFMSREREFAVRIT